VINAYTLAWGLDNFNIDFFKFGLEGTDFFFAEVVRLPITYLESLIVYLRESEQFDTQDKKTIWMMTSMIKPYVYLFTSSMSPIVIMVDPIFMFLYIYDKSLFVDESIPPLNNFNGRRMPRDGVPAALVEYYELNALLWNEFEYLYGTKEAGISLMSFILVYVWAWF
jgi:hypothetical protein